MKIILIKPYFSSTTEALPEVEFHMEPKECLEADVYIGFESNMKKNILDKMPNLKWIQLLSAGYDQIDMDYLRQRDITLTNAKGVYSIPIAEDVVCKILMSNCNALNYIASASRHEWIKGVKRRELSGQTVGIIGTGSIACEIAHRLKPFNVRVIGARRQTAPPPLDFDEVFTGSDGLKYLLSVSDYVVVAADLNSKSTKLLNKDNLKLMKEGASIINIARGAIVDQECLTEMLESGHLAFAGLDVFEEEPLPEDSKLWDMNNVYITPHCSGTVVNNRGRVEQLIVDNVSRYIDGKELLNLVLK